MKKNIFASLIFAVVACLSSCSSSTSPSSGTSGGNGSGGEGIYGVGGNVDELVIAESTFDTVSFLGAGAATVHLTGQKDTSAGTRGGIYAFNHLPAGNYALHFSLSGFETSVVYFSEPKDTGVQQYTRLYPDSWLKATIDLIVPDVDPINGLNVMMHLQSMDLEHIAVGTVYLYLSKTDAIDPQNASTFDVVYHYQPGYAKDSLVKEQLTPQLLHQYYPSGTKVYCKAFASPFDEQFNYPSHDTSGREYYPYLGKYPTPSVPITIP